VGPPRAVAQRQPLGAIIAADSEVAKSSATGGVTGPHLRYQLMVVPPGGNHLQVMPSGQPAPGGFFSSTTIPQDPFEFFCPPLTLGCAPQVFQE
jgi:hypothetical protein